MSKQNMTIEAFHRWRTKFFKRPAFSPADHNTTSPPHIHTLTIQTNDIEYN